MYRRVALGLQVLLLAIKIPILNKIAAKQVARIENLENPRVWNLYSPYGLLLLAIGFPSIKQIELHTTRYHGSRIFFAVSGSAVGLLQGLCSLSIAYTNS